VFAASPHDVGELRAVAQFQKFIARQQIKSGYVTHFWVALADAYVQFAIVINGIKDSVVFHIIGY